MNDISDTGFWEPTTAHQHHGYSPVLISWLTNYLSEYKEKQIYDFGCGQGFYLDGLQKAGFQKLQGFEGEPPTQKVFDNIVKQDLAVPFTLPQKGLCIFLEVAEHVPPKAALYQDHSLDFVFIDANHYYEGVKNDLDAWLPKVKDSGIIAGHDYNPVSWPGVIKAVHEVFDTSRIQVIGSSWMVQL